MIEESLSTHSGDDAIQGARSYRRYRYIQLLTHLLRRNTDPGWVSARELLMENGYEHLARVVVFDGEAPAGSVKVLLPDETVGWIQRKSLVRCSVQEYADWDHQMAESLYDAVVWARHSFRELRSRTRDLWRSEEPIWQRTRKFLRGEGLDPMSCIVETLVPDQGCGVAYLVPPDKRRLSFDIPDREDGEFSDLSDSAPELEDYPHDFETYSYACWIHEAKEGKASDWIFTRPYDWVGQIKEGWNPPPSLFPDMRQS
jgi:hypothetical protein